MHKRKMKRLPPPPTQHTTKKQKKNYIFKEELGNFIIQIQTAASNYKKTEDTKAVDNRSRNLTIAPKSTYQQSIYTFLR